MTAVSVQKLTGPDLMRRACDMTRHPGANPSTMTLERIYQCEHSPIRTQLFWVELHDLPSFVSVHLTRHKIGVEHFVQSMRDDRGGAGDAVVTRETPVNHAMLANAQALITMSRKRLCLNAHRRTVAAWNRLRRAMRDTDPDLARAMVPECAYRNGYCPELRPCAPGPAAITRAYRQPAGDHA